MTILAAILVFCLLILTHELGHFIMARLNGVYVHDFSIGMGPKILSIKGKETQYNLRLFPIGGHCLMMGEDAGSDDSRSFGKKKVWQRITVIAGGPAMNFISAIIIFIITFMFMGIPSLSNEVGGLIEGRAAEAAGVLPGDVIVEINGRPVDTWTDISPAVALRGQAEPADVVLERDGARLALTIQPFFEEESNRWLIGIFPVEKIIYVRQSFFTAIKMGVMQSYTFTKELLLVLVKIITGQMEADVAGPVGVVTIIGEATSYGLQPLLLITAFLCLNLGIINLLPIPALDGSRIVFLLVEGLRGKPIKPEREGMVHFIGFMLLIGLILVVTFNDIMRLIGE